MNPGKLWCRTYTTVTPELRTRSLGIYIPIPVSLGAMGVPRKYYSLVLPFYRYDRMGSLWSEKVLGLKESGSWQRNLASKNWQSNNKELWVGIREVLLHPFKTILLIQASRTKATWPSSGDEDGGKWKDLEVQIYVCAYEFHAFHFINHVCRFYVSDPL